MLRFLQLSYTAISCVFHRHSGPYNIFASCTQRMFGYRPKQQTSSAVACAECCLGYKHPTSVVRDSKWITLADLCIANACAFVPAIRAETSVDSSSNRLGAFVCAGQLSDHSMTAYAVWVWGLGLPIVIVLCPGDQNRDFCKPCGNSSNACFRAGDQACGPANCSHPLTKSATHLHVQQRRQLAQCQPCSFQSFPVPAR